MGLRVLLDTNAVIALLKGNKNILDKIDGIENIAISVISHIEFLSFSNLSEIDKLLFSKFKEQIEVIDVNTQNTVLIKTIILIRKTYKLKLPDAIIAASAITSDALLITADQDFSKISELQSFILDNTQN